MPLVHVGSRELIANVGLANSYPVVSINIHNFHKCLLHLKTHFSHVC